jgi:hypothetical protein
MEERKMAKRVDKVVSSPVRLEVYGVLMYKTGAAVTTLHLLRNLQMGHIS